MNNPTGGSRGSSHLSLLTRVAIENNDNHDEMIAHNYQGEPPHNQIDRQGSPTDDTPISVVTEPIQVPSNSTAGPRIVNGASMSDRILQADDRTAPSRTVAKFDSRFDPLPYHGSLRTNATANPQQKNSFRPSPFTEEGPSRLEHGGMRRDEQLPEGLQMECSFFQQNKPTKLRQSSKESNTLEPRRQEQEAKDSSFDASCAMSKPNMDTNNNGRTTGEGFEIMKPPPVRLNNGPDNDNDDEEFRTEPQQQQPQEQIQPTLSIRNGDPSNRLPTRRFHPLNQQQLREFEASQQHQHQQDSNGISEVLDMNQSQERDGREAEVGCQSEPQRQQRNLLDSFRGRPFYPPQQEQQPLMNRVPANINVSQMNIKQRKHSLRTECNPVKPQQQGPCTGDNGPVQAPPRGTTPIPTSFSDDTATSSDDFEPSLELLKQIGGNRKSSTKKNQKSTGKKRKRNARAHAAQMLSARDVGTNGLTSRSTKANENCKIRTRDTSLFSETAHVGCAIHSDSYLRRVHDMLEDAQSKGFSDVVGWLIHGRAFKIHEPKTFSAKILPKYFQTNQIRSFQRTMSRWGFMRQIEGKDRGAYFHRFFIRGTFLSLVKLTRQGMEQSMQGWIRRGEVPILSSGANPGSHRVCGHDKPDDGENIGMIGTANNAQSSISAYEDPKFLRGTLIEDVRQMLDDAVTQKFTNIVSWLPNGKTFKIHDNAAFQRQICGKYFKTMKLTYFSDSLRTWGFCRLKEIFGKEHNAYYHRLFQYGKPELCRHLSKAQMVDAMKDFREEQKRQKEISWSFFPYHRNQHIVDSNENNGGHTGNKTSRSYQDSQASSVSLYRGEFLDELDMAAVAVVNSLQQTQGYITPYIYEGNPNRDTERNLIRFNANGTESTVRRSCDHDFILDSNYQPEYSKDSIGTSTYHEREVSVTNIGMHRSFLNKSKNNMSYLTRIYQMLEEVETKGETNIISWRSHGRAFKIHDEEAFERDVLTRHFDSTSESFMRCLNHYGFRRMKSGIDRKCWYHRLFVRGVEELVKDLTRQDLVDAMEEWRVPGKEPDFYSSGIGSEFSERRCATKDKGATSTKNSSCDERNQLIGSKLSTASEKKEDPKRLRGTMVEDLRDMIDACEEEGNAHIVSWLPHGKSFRIHKQEEFETLIMHRYFKASKYSYFIDALRNWGFVRIKKGRDKGAYYHKYFIRNMPELSLHLSRAQMKAAMKDW